MELLYDFWRGHLIDVEKLLKQSVNAYIQHYSEIKIGITCNPDRRKAEHHRSNKGWEKMIIKYQTQSVKYINTIEKTLIDYHWDYIANEVAGGGGSNGNPPYYLYVLLRK